jgi:hypothetical protein
MPHEWVNYKSLRTELSFIEILHHYRVELKERGEQWQGFCPLPTHEGKRQSPSFSANVGRGIWQCFGCGAGGNLIEFAARMEDLNPDDPGDFRKAALLLRKTFGGSGGGEREKPELAPKETTRARSGAECVNSFETLFRKITVEAFPPPVAPVCVLLGRQAY